ncbi:PPK2 family polyphosphate kinase [Candidatus Rariloculus sp.]|uniref:PPK2 family polyphosphate kinase n=1 Tax=Candidatus Rariloculus sp. TaxID=3101265 RepID=UPI003D10644C
MFKARPHPFLVPFDGSFRIADAPTRPNDKLLAKVGWQNNFEELKTKLGLWQHKLHADGRYALLLVFQAMDAAGKDSTIRHVLTGVNPAGVRVTSFGRPSQAELSQDFLWRTVAHLPQRGEIGVFNRSYYEEVLAVRVRPGLLAARRMPPIAPDVWTARFRSIVDHERHLEKEGTVVLKLLLNVSKQEQRRRLLRRIEKPNKRWKFEPSDVADRELWDSYIAAYEECLNATSRKRAPWYAIPADNKPFMRWQVARLIIDAFEQLDVDFPSVRPEVEDKFAEAKAMLGKK